MAGGLGKKAECSVGLAGRDPYSFMAFPLVVWLMRRARPDLEVHVLLEERAGHRGAPQGCHEEDAGCHGARLGHSEEQRA
eukprot:609991-Alexandrium_andersonii.AAC.1